MVWFDVLSRAIHCKRVSEMYRMPHNSVGSLVSIGCVQLIRLNIPALRRVSSLLEERSRAARLLLGVEKDILKVDETVSGS
jgi:hypothetical protein